jgi:hypothetical protein
MSKQVQQSKVVDKNSLSNYINKHSQKPDIPFGPGRA